MTKSHILLVAAVAACSLAGCASQVGSEARDRSLLAKPEFSARAANASAAAEALGETASAYGDDQTAVKLFERSVAERPTLTNLFNLAAAYARTGRPAKAVDLYREVAQSRTLVSATTESSVRRNGGEVAFNLSEEAERRMISLQSSVLAREADASVMTDNQAALADATNAQDRPGYKVAANGENRPAQ